MRSALILTTLILSSLTIQQLHAQDFLYRLPGDNVSSFYGIDVGNGLRLGYGLGYSADLSAGTPVTANDNTEGPHSYDAADPSPKVSQAYLAQQMQKKQQVAMKLAKRRAAEMKRLKTTVERKAELARLAEPRAGK